jgi:hydroxymethylpyrimidine pyrophosphatase-like HAD family hydrolase
LWDLHDAGLRLVAVTGRPSGWAELLVRQWPIDGAVTENGAVFVVRKGLGVDVLVDGSEAELASRAARLDALVAAAAAAMPRIHLADDVRSRRSDVAWDIGERRVVPEEEVAALARLVVDAGARTTRSTVHLHASFERDDKASGALRFVRDRFGEDPGSAIFRWAFVGDSANDAACFAALKTTFGVANVRAFVFGTSSAPPGATGAVEPPSVRARMSVPPRWIATRERGEGFAEIAQALLAAR